MKSNRVARIFTTRQFRAPAALLLVALLQGHVLSQRANSSSVSVRGTAKLDGEYVVDDVQVVVTPLNTDGRPVGRPVPAKVDNSGAYRVEGVIPGKYDIRAWGKHVEGALPGVSVTEGDYKTYNVILKKAPKQTRVHGNARGADGRPASRARVYIYPAAFPPSVCPGCALADVDSDEEGAFDFPALAAGRSYIVAIGIKGVNLTSPDMVLVADDKVAVGEEPEVRIRLQLSGGERPRLTATLLQGPDAPLNQGPSRRPYTVQKPDGGRAAPAPATAAAATSGGGGPAASAGGTPAPAKVSEEDKKRAAEAAAERARIEEANAKAAELNTKLPEILKAGNDAFAAKKYDEAITHYDQGLALDQTQAVFHRNKAIVLRARGVEKFNAAVKAKDQPGKDAAKEDFKNSAEGMEKALAAQRDHASKNAGAAGAAPAAGGPPNEELGFLFDRSESYRVALQTGAGVNTEAAVKAFEEYLAVETDPAKKMRGQNGLGDALFMGGKIDESIATFRQVIATNPQNLDAMLGLGTALAAKGSLAEGGGGAAMIAEARDLFQEFIKKAPETHPKKADALATAQYLDETIKAAKEPKPSTGAGRTTGAGRRRP